MSTSSLRAFAVAVAAIIALLTGIGTGVIAGRESCAAATPVTTANPTAAVSAPAAGGGGGSTATKSTACSDSFLGEFEAVPAVVGFAGAVLVAGVFGSLLWLSGRRESVRVVPVSGPPAGDGAGRQADADRAVLVQACIYVRDRVTSKALADRLGTALHDAGVQTLEPTGVRFDPAHHEAGGSAHSEDPAKIGSIAAVEVPGYADRAGRVLRAPVVTVFQASRRADDRTQREHR